MKSIDEVTKALSMCGRKLDCIGCPYENISYPTEIGNTCIDVMHYDALYYMQDRIDECQEANPPLTWDELKEMKGKPVWVEYTDDEEQTGWFLIAKNPERPIFDKPKLFTLIREDGKFYLTISGYGKRWKAYRKEKNE